MLAILVSAPASAEAPDGYRVGPRDVLMVDVYGEPDLSRSVTVSESGMITMPYLGRVPVEGRSVEEITRDLEERFRAGVLVNPELTVRVEEFRSKPFQVIGAVKNPGIYYVDRPLTVRAALGEAGWIQTEKSSRQVSIRKDNGERIVFSVDQLGGAAGDRLVEPGDVISVEEGQWVYVSGEVKQEGEIVYYEGLTVYEALTRAGGPAATARLRRAFLVRQDGERIQVNLRRIRDSKDPDVLMKPGDRLVVHESPL